MLDNFRTETVLDRDSKHLGSVCVRGTEKQICQVVREVAKSLDRRGAYSLVSTRSSDSFHWVSHVYFGISLDDGILEVQHNGKKCK